MSGPPETSETPATGAGAPAAGWAEHPSAPGLRRRAEDALRAQTPAQLAALPPEEASRALHELRVHQIELEMQNEELRRVQKELEVSRERYFELYELAPAGYCSIGETGLILEANLALASLLGEVRGALLGRAFSRFVLAQDQDLYYLQRKRLFEHGGPQSCELRLARREGAECWVSMVSTLAEDAQGAPVVRAVLVDISERKLASEALHLSEARLRMVLEEGPIGMISARLADGRFTAANAVFCRAIGYTEDELKRLSVLDITHPADHGADIEAASKMRAGQIPYYQIEKRYVRKNGEVLWAYLTATVIRDADGHAISFMGMIEDRTERKQADLALERMLAEQEAILGSEVVGIVKARDRNIVWCNSRFEAMLGWEAGQLTGQSTRVIFPDAAAYTTLGDTAYAVIDGGGVFRTEMRYLRAEGLVGWADVTGAKLYPDGDETIWSFIDISERKRAELELEQSSERVSALSRRLIEVQEAERGALARELHDEIGQVLTAVRLHLKVLDREDAQGKHRESLGKALSVVERAIGQVRGLSLKLRPPVLDDLGLLPALRWLALQQSGSGGLRIDIEAVPEGVSVPRGVAEAAYRIAQEALTNVLRHADAGRATIRLEQDAERLAVSIRDDGRGFDSTEVRRMGGFGLLGMQERVKLAGGTLGVSSEPGGGTEVRAEFELGR